MKNKWHINKFLNQQERKASQALEIVGEHLVGEAKSLVPVGTPESTGIKGYVGGTLKSSITKVIDKLTLYVGTNVFYGPYVEFGTKNSDGTTRMKKRPYLTPLVNSKAARRKIQSLFNRLMRQKNK